MLTLSKTYAVVTEESAKDGDFADHGFEYEDKEFDSIEDIASEIENTLGYIEPDFYPCQTAEQFASIRWVTGVDAIVDYIEGTETTESIHLDDLTDDERMQLWPLIKHLVR